MFLLIGCICIGIVIGLLASFKSIMLIGKALEIHKENIINELKEERNATNNNC